MKASKQARTVVKELRPSVNAPVTELSDTQLRSVVGGLPCATYNYETNQCYTDGNSC